MDDRAYWIWFADSFGCGTRRAHEVLEHFGHPKNVFEASAETLERGNFTGKKAIAHDIEKAVSVLEYCEKIGVTVLTPDSEEYPEQLMSIYARPSVLYVVGSLAGISEKLCIAMVGTRKMSEYGSRVATSLALELAEVGVVVISGMAVGVDQVCHKAAIKAEGITIGVLGCGIDVDYPAKSSALKRMMTKRGAIITEYPPNMPPYPGNFTARNRIISGLANGVVVVEAGEVSGSLITAGHALNQGRDVFAVPGRIDDDFSGGTSKLLRQGAKPVTCAADIIEEYSHLDIIPASAASKLTQEQNREWDKRSEEVEYGEKRPEWIGDFMKKPAPKKQPAPEYLTPVQLKIYELLSLEPIHADNIGTTLDLPITAVLEALTILEIYGLVAAKSGRNYVSC